MNNDAFLVIVTWPDGTEGLLFPRPGNVPIADTLEQGHLDFETARQHLREFSKSVAGHPELEHKAQGATVRLIHFQLVKVLNAYHHES